MVLPQRGVLRRTKTSVGRMSSALSYCASMKSAAGIFLAAAEILQRLKMMGALLIGIRFAGRRDRHQPRANHVGAPFNTCVDKGFN
jgi:hypothetical protein